MKRQSLLALFLIAGCGVVPVTEAQLVITTAGSPVVQNFDALVGSGTSAASGGPFAEGWSFLESSANADGNYRAGSGTGSTGDTYSFGVAGVNPVGDRSLGMLQSTNLTTIPGFKFTNRTGSVISSLVVGYTGELWRLSAAADQLLFAYQVGDVALNAVSGWMPVAALQFTTPAVGSGAVDGNSSGYRTVLQPVVIPGLYLPDGATVTFRWWDASAGSSAGMGIDDFSLTLVPAFGGFFRSKASGSWNNAATWEQSSDGAAWGPVTAVPTDVARSTVIRNGHVVTADGDLTISKVVVEAGGQLVHSGGVLTLTDAAGEDLVLEGGSVFELAAGSVPVLAGGATVRANTGAQLVLSGTGNLAALQAAAYHYADGSVLEYRAAVAPVVPAVFFSGQDPGAVPVFRYNSGYAGSAGSSGAVTLAGKLEVAAGKTLNLSGVAGTLTIRDGIGVAGNLQAGTLLLNGSRAELNGSGTINSHLTIESGCTATLGSNLVFSKNNQLTVKGVLDLQDRQLQSAGGAASLVVAGTGVVKTANSAGLAGAAGSLKAGSFTLSFLAGATVDYNGTGSQVVSTSGLPAYPTLRLSGAGPKTAQAGANLVVLERCVVESGATLALSGSASEHLYLNNNATLEVKSGGVFDTGGESQVTTSAGAPSVLIGGRFVTRDAQGFLGSGATLPSIVPVLQPGCVVEFGRAGDQTVQATLDYEDLVFSGSGVKTPASALSLNGTLSLSGPVVADGSAHTIGGLGNSLVMSGGSRLVVGGTGTRPALTGTYTLAPGTTIEFSNTNGTTCFIRQGAIQYANIEVTGTNVSAPGSGIQLQPGGRFTVKPGGVFKTAAVNGLVAGSNAAILSVNAPTVVLEPGSTIEYNGADQVLTTETTYSQVVISGSGVKTAAAPFAVDRSFTRSGAAVLGGSSPVYKGGGRLVYADAAAGRSYSPGLEWPEADGPDNIRVSLSGTGTPAVVLTKDAVVRGGLQLDAGSLDLQGYRLSVAGAINGAGYLKGSRRSSVELSGGVSVLQFSPVLDGSSNALDRLEVRGGTATLNSALHLYGVLEISAGSLDLNGQPLVLKSNADSTARVAERKGVLAGAGNVTVERYVEGGSGRRWRLLTAPVAGTSVNAAWQEGRTWNGTGSEAGGTGTLITGAAQGDATTANSRGFDFWPAVSGSAASIRQYQGAADPKQAGWLPLPTTTGGGAFDQQQVYLLFVRGDRTVTAGGGSTVLRPRGQLGDLPVYTIPLPANRSHVLAGNPYASPLNLQRVADDNRGSIQPWFWLWQASLGTGTGGYVLLRPVAEGSPVYETVPDGTLGGATVAPVVHSGAGFFVVPKNPNVAATLVVQQQHKEGKGRGLPVFRQMGPEVAKVYVNLYAPDSSGAVLLDGVLAEYGVSGGGIAKAVQQGENLSVADGERELAVSSKGAVTAGDSLRLRLRNLKEQGYRLRVRTTDFGDPALAASLVDRYSGAEVPLDLKGGVVQYPFSVTGDAGSADPQRFLVVFRAAQALPVVIRSFRGVEQGGGVALEWVVDEAVGVQYYEIERSEDGARFTSIARVAAQGGSGLQVYTWFDAQPAAVTYYRVQVKQAVGRDLWSAVVVVRLERSGEALVVYPGLVTGDGASLKLVNRVKGAYTIRFVNAVGQVVRRQVVAHGGGTATYALSVAGLGSGSYTVVVEGPDGGVEQRKVVVVR